MDLQYWLNGEPVLPDSGLEEIKYWLNGEPYVIYEAGVADLDINVSDQINITEDITITVLPPDLAINVNDQLNITENTAELVISDINVLDQINITEDTTETNPNLGNISVSDQVNITEDVNNVSSLADINPTITYKKTVKIF